MGRGAWPAMVHGVAENCTQLKKLSTRVHVYILFHILFHYSL